MALAKRLSRVFNKVWFCPASWCPTGTTYPGHCELCGSWRAGLGEPPLFLGANHREKEQKRRNNQLVKGRALRNAYTAMAKAKAMRGITQGCNSLCPGEGTGCSSLLILKIWGGKSAEEQSVSQADKKPGSCLIDSIQMPKLGIFSLNDCYILDPAQ